MESKGGAPSGSDNKATSRYIPSEVRERVQARAGYQCEAFQPSPVELVLRRILSVSVNEDIDIRELHGLALARCVLFEVVRCEEE